MIPLKARGYQAHVEEVCVCLFHTGEKIVKLSAIDRWGFAQKQWDCLRSILWSSITTVQVGLQNIKSFSR